MATVLTEEPAAAASVVYTIPTVFGVPDVTPVTTRPTLAVWFTRPAPRFARVFPSVANAVSAAVPQGTPVWQSTTWSPGSKRPASPLTAGGLPGWVMIASLLVAKIWLDPTSGPSG